MAEASIQLKVVTPADTVFDVFVTVATVSATAVDDMLSEATEIATIDERASLRQAALFIEKHQIGCLPIVTDGILRGIITDTDFVGVAINLLELAEETEPLEDEVEVA